METQRDRRGVGGKRKYNRTKKTEEEKRNGLAVLLILADKINNYYLQQPQKMTCLWTIKDEMLIYAIQSSRRLEINRDGFKS